MSHGKGGPKSVHSSARYPVVDVEPEPSGVMTGKSSRIKKERMTIHIPIELIDRIKNVVFWTPGMTLTGFAEDAFTEALEKLEKQNGGPFSPRTQELRGGRPMK